MDELKGNEITSLVIVGSLAYDDLESEAGKADGMLGGSATYAGLAASFHTRNFDTSIGLVGVVGSDFRAEDWKLLVDNGLDMSGIERSNGKTFRWRGRYEGRMDQAETLETQLNVFSSFKPNIPNSWSTPNVLFCANIHPLIQKSVIESCNGAKLTALDSMNLWISTEFKSLSEVLRLVDMAILNDDEVRMLAKDSNLVRAGQSIISGEALFGGKEGGFGPEYLIIKRGEHGVLALTPEGPLAFPAVPTTEVVDPTGCGDTFAGTMLACLSKLDNPKPTLEELREALLHATVTASFTLGAFGTECLSTLDNDEYQGRVNDYRRMLGL